MNKQNKQRVNDLWLNYSREQWPSVPDYARPPFPYKDSTTNGLTNCVVQFLLLEGWQAERISNTGRYIDNSKVVTDVVGFKRKVGTGKFIKGSGTNGTADISSTIHGMSVKIEIKFGKDRQSEAQKKYQKQIESAGGVYLIVREFDSFIEWYDKTEEKLRHIKGLLF